MDCHQSKSNLDPYNQAAAQKEDIRQPLAQLGPDVDPVGKSAAEYQASDGLQHQLDKLIPSLVTANSTALFAVKR